MPLAVAGRVAGHVYQRSHEEWEELATPPGLGTGYGAFRLAQRRRCTDVGPSMKIIAFAYQDARRVGMSSACRWWARSTATLKRPSRQRVFGAGDRARALLALRLWA